MTQALVALLQP